MVYLRYSYVFLEEVVILSSFKFREQLPRLKFEYSVTSPRPFSQLLQVVPEI